MGGFKRRGRVISWSAGISHPTLLWVGLGLLMAGGGVRWVAGSPTMYPDGLVQKLLTSRPELTWIVSGIAFVVVLLTIAGAVPIQYRLEADGSLTAVRFPGRQEGLLAAGEVEGVEVRTGADMSDLRLRGGAAPAPAGHGLLATAVVGMRRAGKSTFLHQERSSVS